MNYRTVVVNGKLGLMEERITEGNHKSAVAFVKGTSKSAKLNTGWRIEVGEIERIVYADCSGDEPQMYYISKGERVLVRLATQADIDAQNNSKAEESETMNEKVNPILVYGKKREDGFIQIFKSADSSKVSVTEWVDGDYAFSGVSADADNNIIMTEEDAMNADIVIEADVVNYFCFDSFGDIDAEAREALINDAPKHGVSHEFMAGSLARLGKVEPDANREIVTGFSDEFNLSIYEDLAEMRYELDVEFDLNIAYAIATAKSDTEVKAIDSSYAMMNSDAEDDNPSNKGVGDFMLAYVLVGMGDDCGADEMIDRFMRRFRVINNLPQ